MSQINKTLIIEQFNTNPNRKRCGECDVPVELVEVENDEITLVCYHDSNCKHAHLNPVKKTKDAGL